MWIFAFHTIHCISSFFCTGLSCWTQYSCIPYACTKKFTLHIKYLCVCWLYDVCIHVYIDISLSLFFLISLHSGRKAACILWSKLLLCRKYFGEHSQHKPVRDELNNILRTRVAATNSLALTPGVCALFCMYYARMSQGVVRSAPVFYSFETVDTPTEIRIC